MSGLNDDPTGSKLAARALAQGMITQAQYDEALTAQKAMGGTYHLGALLVAKGALAEADLQALLSGAPAAHPSKASASPSRVSVATASSPPRPSNVATPASRPASAPRPAAPPAPAPKAATFKPDDALAALLAEISDDTSTPPAPGPPPRPVPPPAARPYPEPLDFDDVGDLPEPRPAPPPARRPPSTTQPPPGPPPLAAAPRTPAVSVRALDTLLQAALKANATDLHLHPGLPVQHRRVGELANADQKTLDAAALDQLLLPAIPPALRDHFETVRDVDFTYVTADGQRARANIYRTQRGLDGVFRLIPKRIPSLAELGLPETIAKFTHYSSGLLLVTGPAGSGKTTTLNALVDLINQERDDHILTIEDPVEFVHESKRCLVNQRQVHRDTRSFSRALKGALREDPDIIVIGELRDYETISLAITAAETGHLVLGSLHTAYATRTIMRMLDVFPAGERAQVRSMLSESLRAIVAQKLLPGVDGKMHVAPEIMVVTPAIANLIRDDKMHQLQGAMQMSKQLGARLMDDSIRELVAKKLVTAEVARAYLIGGGQQQDGGLPPPR